MAGLGVFTEGLDPAKLSGPRGPYSIRVSTPTLNQLGHGQETPPRTSPCPRNHEVLITLRGAPHVTYLAKGLGLHRLSSTA